MPTILIIDDESSAVELLTLILEQNGFSVLTASNGQEGLDRAREKRPDLIVTDVLMPVMDGYEFYKEAKKDPVVKNIPVIIVTARGAMRSAFEVVGADCFFEKPVDPPQLVSTINTLLEHSNFSGKRSGKKRVVIFGTYHEVVDEMAAYARSLGHDVKIAFKAADVLKESVEFNEQVLILEVQDETGVSNADLIRGLRILPELKNIPIVLYHYYRATDLGSDGFRERVETIGTAKDQCMEAGATDYFDRYNKSVFEEKLLKYL